MSTVSDQTAGTMEAIRFDFKPFRLAKSKLWGYADPSGHWGRGGPIGLRKVPQPKLVTDEWVIMRTAYCGICGSDMTQLMLNASFRNPLRTFASFPNILGHEVVGTIEEVGAKVSRVKTGDRVVVNPWFSCAPRGIEALCPRCQVGDFSHCGNFLKGDLPPGILLGFTREFGGYAPQVAVHQSQCIAIPPTVPFEQAVLTDPLSVAFHSCLLLDPQPDQQILVYGLGAIGLATVMCLKNIFKIERVVAVGRHDFQKKLALQFGAEKVFASKGAALITEVAAHTQAELLYPYNGPPWSMDGVDGAIDTIGSAASIEAELRFVRALGRIVISGVTPPGRFENTPHYFKELDILGSNGAAMENFQGQKAHAFEFIQNFLADGLIDPSPLLTHTYPLDQYRQAFDAMAFKKKSSAIKVAFTF